MHPINEVDLKAFKFGFKPLNMKNQLLRARMQMDDVKQSWLLEMEGY